MALSNWIAFEALLQGNFKVSRGQNVCAGSAEVEQLRVSHFGYCDVVLTAKLGGARSKSFKNSYWNGTFVC